MSEFTNMNTSRTKPRRQRPKIEKTNEEFKQHERILMHKRNQEVNNAVTKKCHQIWNQHINKPKPNPLEFNFVYHNIEKYLAVCDTYEPSQHKDPKQKWWNNQKASEMSQGFLPSILNSTDQMAEFVGQQVLEVVQTEFTHYCIFELLETAVSSVFSTMRSGSNEVFLRTSFQYSKANLRKKLESYFSQHELQTYDLKMRKKKDLWSKLIKEKKEKFLIEFINKRDIYNNYNNNCITTKDESNLPPSVHSDNMSSLSSSTISNINTNINTIPIPIPINVPPINWNETNHTNIQYQPFQTIPLSTPYNNNNNILKQQQQQQQCNKLNNYGSHRQCVDCLSYMNKMSELLNINNKLQHETNHLKQINREYVADRQTYRNKYQSLLLQLQDNNTHNTPNNINNNNW
eukprot:779137_1